MVFRLTGDDTQIYLTKDTDPEDPVDVLDESLTGTDPYAAPAAGPAR